MKEVPISVECAYAHRKAELLDCLHLPPRASWPACLQLYIKVAAVHALNLGSLLCLHRKVSYYLRYAITSVNSTKQQALQFANTVGKTGSHTPGMKLNACV